MKNLGDIVVFKAGNDWVGKSIAWLTNSDVSHAAMVYGEDSIVEMGPHGIVVNKVSAASGDGAYQLRLDPERDPQPLIEAADTYINAKTRYDFPALVILGGLLIYRHIRPTPEFVMITDLILRAACKEVDKLIQSVILHNPDEAMVCSQLVYQIYRDCGKEYELKLAGGDLQSGLEYASNSVRLIDLLDQMPEDSETDCVSDDNFEEDPESLARRLYESMTEIDGNDLDALQAVDVKPLLEPAKALLEKLEEFLEKMESDIPIDALFVTPSDLVYHVKNLTHVQTVNIERRK